MTRVFFAIFLFALTSLVCAEDKKDDPKKDELKLTKDEQGVIDLSNAERKKLELAAFKPNAQLMEAARGHAVNMAKQEKLTHELDDKKPADRVKDAGYKYTLIGENVAWNPRSPKEVVTGWMNSDIHKENILKKEFTEIGVGVAKNKKGERYWVQVFGVPAKQ
jgi:uncharacterized protein YkwD